MTNIDHGTNEIPELSVNELEAVSGGRDMLQNLSRGIAAGNSGSSESSNSLMSATQQMQETQMSFNLQYLQLQ
jgi:hypothetical protein